MSVPAGASGPDASAGAPVSRPTVDVMPRRSTHRLVLALGVAAIVVGATFAADWATGGAVLPFLEHRSPASDPCYGPPWTLSGLLGASLAPSDNASFVLLAAEFGALMKGCVTFRLNASAYTGGRAALGTGSTVFEIATGVPAAAERQGLPHATLYFPETVGAIAVVYHPTGLPDELNLTPGALAGIYRGTVANWTDPALGATNPIPTTAGPVAPAYLTGATAATAALTAFLSATNASWNRTIGEEAAPVGFRGTAMPNASALLAYVDGTPGAIGYLPYGPGATGGVSVARVENAAARFALPNATGLTEAASGAGTAALAAIERSNGTVTPGPNLSAVAAPGNLSYPLTTFDYVLLFHDLGTAYGSWLTMQGSLWLLWFFAWLAGSGQLGLTGTGSVPMPGVLSAMTLTVLEHVTYEGEAVLTSALGESEGSGEGGNETGGA